MNRILIARMLVVFILLGSLIPFLPGEPKNPFGVGGFQRTLNRNQAVSAYPPGSAGRRALLRFRGILTLNQVSKIMDYFQRIQAEGLDPDVHVQARDFPRNEMWVFAYDLYPVRVIGRFREEGGSFEDPVLEEADWILTQYQYGIELERVP